jgi:hypothetical protein
MLQHRFPGASRKTRTQENAGPNPGRARRQYHVFGKHMQLTMSNNGSATYSFNTSEFFRFANECFLIKLSVFEHEDVHLSQCLLVRHHGNDTGKYNTIGDISL